MQTHPLSLSNGFLHVLLNCKLSSSEVFSSVSLTLFHHETHSGLGSLLSLDLCVYRAAMRAPQTGFATLGWVVDAHQRAERDTPTLREQQGWCLDAPAPLEPHQDPTTDSSPPQHKPTLTKLAHPLPMIICISAFSRWFLRQGNAFPGLLTHQQSKEVVPAFHQPLLPRPLAQRHSQGSTAGLFDRTRSQSRDPVMPLWADVVQQSRTKPALRNNVLTALFTCSFFHKIGSHNSNSPTLLATDHLSCRQHTGCLSTKGFSPAAVRAEAIRALRDGEYKGKWEKQSPFPEQEGDLNHFLPLVGLGIFFPGKDSCCLSPTILPYRKAGHVSG